MRHTLPLILVSLVNLCFVKALTEDDQLPVKRTKREFSVFTIVTFQNLACSFVDDSPNTGVCFPSSECDQKGGTADGNCASGFGVCCRLVVRDSGSIITNNCTYIQNPLFPNTQSTIGTTATQFTYNVDSSSDICQLRLDFANFVISQPVGATGSCASIDNFVITSPTGGTLTPICGTNTGLHVYVETGRSATDTQLQFLFNQVAANAADVTRTYNIKVSMIPCNAPFKAPTDCLQYFTANADTVTAFNFPAGNTIFDSAYLTCIRNNVGMCAIQWAQSPGLPIAFALGVNAAGNAIAPSSCNVAYVQIPGTVTNLNVHCGGTFTNGEGVGANPETVITRELPFTIHTTITAVPLESRGYSLMYTQIGC